jgi:hypothetical protein
MSLVSNRALLLIFCVLLLTGQNAWAGRKPLPMDIVGPATELSPSPYASPEMFPTPNQGDTPEQNDPVSAPTAPAKQKQVPDSRPGQHMTYEPYNTFSRELDLWNLEDRRFIRSPIVLSPDYHFFAYSEVLFSPSNRQTLSRLYRVSVQALPPLETREIPQQTGGQAISWALRRLDPDKTLQHRERLLEVGYNKLIPFDFKTLTIIDWSATGQRLLIKEKSGMLHLGLRTTDVLVYDQVNGNVTIYPELRRAIAFYWRTQGNLPNINRLNWELYPLGWEPGSDSKILFKAWALDPTNRKFLGVWRYDIDQLSTDRLSLDDMPVNVAANGWLAIPPLASPSPPSGSAKALKKAAKPPKTKKPKKPSKVRVHRVYRNRHKKSPEQEPRFEIPDEEMN